MARRGKVEQAICNYLFHRGWQSPTLRAQAVAFPGATPARGNKSGKGRGSIVFDIQRTADVNGVVCAYLLGIKAGKARKTTVTVTTGRGDTHIESVVQAAERGMDIPISVISLPKVQIEGKGADSRIVSFDGLYAATVRVGACIREFGLQQRTQGQGKGRGNAKPVSWGIKLQKAKSGKVYEYISLSANLPACGATWTELSTLADLDEYFRENAEGFFI